MSTAPEDMTAEEFMEDAINSGWSDNNILTYLQRENRTELEPEDVVPEARIWGERYDLDDMDARKYAEAFLSYQEEHDIDRDEFHELVDEWNYDSKV